MKTSTSKKAILTGSITALVLGMSATAQTDGTWILNANGNWSLSSNWLGGDIADGATATANFNVDINADRTITLDTPRTIGNLSFRDTANGTNAYILAGANVLTLNDGAGKPTITAFPRSNGIIARIDTVLAGTNGFELVAGTPGTLGQIGLNAANTFTGAVTVGANTRLRADVSDALGARDALGIDPNLAVNFTEVLSGGAFQMNSATANALNYGSELIKVQGVGTDGTGAIINTNTSQQNALQQVQLTGDTTFGGTQRWDIRTGTAATGRLHQNGFNLTKTGTNQISLVNVNVIGGGNIEINQGVFAVEGGSIIGGAGEIRVNTGGNLNFWVNTGAFTRQIVANGGAINHTNTTATATAAAPVRLQTTTTIQQAGTGTLNLNGAITESGGAFGIVKTGTGTLNLGGANTFTGLIDVTAGTVAVTAAGSLAAGNSVSVASGAVFNVNAKPNHTIATGRSLTIGRTGATGANDVVGSIVMSTGSNFEIGTSGRNGGANPVRIATISGGLTFNGGSTVYQDLNNTTTTGGGVNDLIAVGGALTLNGVTNINVTPVGGGLAAGNYTLMTYGGALTGTAANLALTGIPGGTRQSFAFSTATLGAVQLAVTGAAANLIWSGGLNANAWDLNTTANWLNGGSPDTFQNLDSVTFDGTGSNTPAVNLVGSLVPGNITVTGAQDYTFGGTGTLDGGAITKSGAGTLTITGTGHTFSGAVQINGGAVSVSAINNAGVAGALGITSSIGLNGGTLEYTGASQNINRSFNLGASGGTVRVTDAASRLGTNQLITGTGALTVSGAGSFMVGQNDAAFTYATPTLGSGNLALNPHIGVGSATSYNVVIDPAALTNFTGNLILAAPASGSFRSTATGNGGTTQALLGGAASVIVEDGAQFWVAPTSTITTNATITGVGFIEGNGTGLGAIRMDNSTYNGNITIAGSAAINAHNSVGTINGNISGGTLLFGGTNFANNITIILTGTNTQNGTLVNSGGTGNQTSLLQVGTGGTTGTVGSGPITINGDTKNGILRIIRSDGYTLEPGQTITGGGSNTSKAFLDLDVQGAGFNSNGQAVNLASGQLRIGGFVADAKATFSGPLTAGNILVGVLNATVPTTNASLTFATGAVVTATNLNISNGGGTAPLGNTNGASVTIEPGTTVAIANNLFLGEQNSSSSIVTQNGGDVSVGGQFRIAHWPNENSSYDINGGTLSVTGTPTQFPQGGTETAGGIYLGIDGTATFNQNAGTVSTRFVVLDNRPNTAGNDAYNLNGGELIITNAYGIINRNASGAFNLNGGTLTAGTDFNLDTNLVNVGAPSTLNTNGNTVTALGPINGFTTLTLSGGGTLTLDDSATANFGGGGSLAGAPISINAGTTLRSNRTADATWFSVIDGAGNLVKDGAGNLTLTESNTGFTGEATINAGALVIGGALASSGSVVVTGSGALSGNGTVGSITLDAGTIRPGVPALFPGDVAATADGNIATLNAASLTVNAGSNLALDFDPLGPSNDLLAITGTATFAGASTITPYFSTVPTAGTYTIVTAGSVVPTVLPTVTPFGGATRLTFGVTTTATTLSLTVSGTPLTLDWTGANGTVWDVNNTVNWEVGATPEKFFTYDSVVFDDNAATFNVDIDPGGVQPNGVLVNNSLGNDYVFSGGSINGGGVVTKQGDGTLVVNSPNAYSGGTNIEGGILRIGTNNQALGTGFDVSVADGATFDVNGQSGAGATRRYDLTIEGDGVAGQAAIWNSGGAVVNNPIYRSITLTDDASIGGVNRYDMNGGAVDGTGVTFNGGDFKLTKVGPNELWWAPSSATVGDIVVNAGTFGIQSSGQLGFTGSIIINPNGTVNTFGGQTNFKPIEINGGVLATNNGLNTYTGEITLTGAGTSNRIAPGAGLQLNLSGRITGSGGFEKQTTGILDLQGFDNDYSGDTRISGGTLRTSGGILSPNSTIDMNGGILDVNFSSQTVAGLKGATGTILGSGELIVNQAADTIYGGIITAGMTVTKQGIGELTLTGQQDYPTLNAQVGTVNLDAPLGTGASTINATGSVNLSASQTLAALNIGAGGVVTLVDAPPAPAAGFAAPIGEIFDDGGASGAASVEVVPEPATAGLLVFGALGLLARRRRPSR